MPTLISIPQTLALIVLFAGSMIALVLWSARREKLTKDSFLVADRRVGWFRAALSIAVSWVWAPAIFIASMQSYTKGIAGAFWFIVPNVICFFLFTPVAVKIRRMFPAGYTLPQFIAERFAGDRKTHLAYLTIFFCYQLGAIIINALAGGILLNLLSGIDINLAIVAMTLVALAYSLISGLKASIITDVVQMLFVVIIAMVLIPWVVIATGGASTMLSGLGGVSGEFSSIFHPGVAYSFGIAMSLSLLSGPMCDQMFFQRTFAVPQNQIVKTFVAGGLIFGMVPVLLCVPGFIAAAPQLAGSIDVTNPEMVAPIVIGKFLPNWALLLFTVMAFCGLCSTLDSAYCAISSLGAIDIYQRYLNPQASAENVLDASRKFMLFMAVLGTGIALLKPQLIWLFLIYGVTASVGFFPIVLSIYWKSMPRQAPFWAIVISLGVCLPLSVYANVTQHVDLIVSAAILSVVMSLTVCGAFGLRAALPNLFGSAAPTRTPGQEFPEFGGSH